MNRPWLRRWRFFHLAGVLLGLHVLLLGGLWRYQTRLMFFPSPWVKSTPAVVGIKYEAIWLDSQVHGWWIPAGGLAEEKTEAQTDAGGAVLLYLHGNGSNLGDLVHRLQRFHQWGYGILAIDYRGYGRSAGPFPSEQQVYADAETAWRYLVEQREIPAERIVLYGRSIGGAIAIHLGMSHPNVAGLILESTFTSMAAMVNYYLPLPMLPVERLLTQRFDSLEKLRSLSVPVLVMHGTADRVVPATMGRALYEASSTSLEHKTLVWVDSAGHSNLPTVAGERYDQAVKTFMARYAE